MVDAANTLLQEFHKQKVSQESEVLQAAQRFVNQFRALRLFRESFVQEFNEQLLACSPDVRRFLPSLMGGNEVRSYLEFLERQQPHPNKTEENSNQSQIASGGYLPSPDSDLTTQQDSSENASVSRAEFQQMQEQQKILMEQTQQLLKRLNQQGSSSVGSSAVGRYSEIIEEDS